MKINPNTILALLGCLGVFAPDIAAVASTLAELHISWLVPVVRGLGLLAAFCAAAPLLIPKLRPLLALLGLATPPGAPAPWVPGKPGDPVLTDAPATTATGATPVKPVLVQAVPLPRADDTPVTVENPTGGPKAGR